MDFQLFLKLNFARSKKNHWTNTEPSAGHKSHGATRVLQAEKGMGEDSKHQLLDLYLSCLVLLDFLSRQLQIQNLQLQQLNEGKYGQVKGKRVEIKKFDISNDFNQKNPVRIYDQPIYSKHNLRDQHSDDQDGIENESESR